MSALVSAAYVYKTILRPLGQEFYHLSLLFRKDIQGRLVLQLSHIVSQKHLIQDLALFVNQSPKDLYKFVHALALSFTNAQLVLLHAGQNGIDFFQKRMDMLIYTARIREHVDLNNFA